jgi:hypothetical protein
METRAFETRLAAGALTSSSSNGALGTLSSRVAANGAAAAAFVGRHLPTGSTQSQRTATANVAALGRARSLWV